MAKQTRELFLMLFIGILIGVSAVMVLTQSEWIEGDDSTASTVKRMNVEKYEDIAVAPTSESFSASSLDFPLPPSIPDNTRVGLSLPDQPAGKTVVLTALSVVGTKWIAIYDDHSGKPGWILGARRVREGDTSTTVDLLREEGTISGHVYYAAILNDDGDDSFNRLTDLPPLSPDKVNIVRWRAQ